MRRAAGRRTSGANLRRRARRVVRGAGHGLEAHLAPAVPDLTPFLIWLAAGLSHPNIVRLFDSGETEGGRLYAVFEYVPGSTLKEVLAREGSLGWGETVHLMTQVLDALSCAHARGVIHRDLKPENIMLTKTGARRNALVLDFGLG